MVYIKENSNRYIACLFIAGNSCPHLGDVSGLGSDLLCQFEGSTPVGGVSTWNGDLI